MVAAAAVTASVSAHAAPTAVSRATRGSNVVDRTCSCRVRPQRYVDLDASVTLPPAQNRPRPARLRPLAFLDWAPRKIKGYFGKARVSTGTV